MDTKYCTFSDEQMDEMIQRLHSRVHVLLTYKENGFDDLDNYFDRLLTHIGAMNSLFGNPTCLGELLIKIEVARMEDKKGDFKSYRRAILDAHSIINQLRG